MARTWRSIDSGWSVASSETCPSRCRRSAGRSRRTESTAPITLRAVGCVPSLSPGLIPSMSRFRSFSSSSAVTAEKGESARRTGRTAPRRGRRQARRRGPRIIRRAGWPSWSGTGDSPDRWQRRAELDRREGGAPPDAPRPVHLLACRSHRRAVPVMAGSSCGWRGGSRVGWVGGDGGGGAVARGRECGTIGPSLDGLG